MYRTAACVAYAKQAYIGYKTEKNALDGCPGIHPMHSLEETAPFLHLTPTEYILYIQRDVNAHYTGKSNSSSRKNKTETFHQVSRASRENLTLSHIIFYSFKPGEKMLCSMILWTTKVSFLMTISISQTSRLTIRN